MEFPIHWLIILVVVLILFGGRKIPVRGFKEGMSGNHQAQSTPPPPAAPAQSQPTDKPAEEKKS